MKYNSWSFHPGHIAVTYAVIEIYRNPNEIISSTIRIKEGKVFFI